MNAISAQTARSHAQSLAAQAGKPLSELIAGLILKGEEVAAGPVTTLNLLRKQIGDDKLSVEFPRLDTDETDDDVGNGYAEFYKAQDVVNGENKTRDANFFTDFWLTTDAGKAQVHTLEQIKFAQSKTERDKAAQQYLDMSPDKLANLKKKIQNAKSKGRGYIRKAIGCWFVMSDLADAVAAADTGTCKKGDALVTLAYADAANANTFPFDLIDNTRLRFFRPMTVGDVMKLDVADAIKSGGNLYDALEKQLKRDTAKGKTGKIPALTNVDMATDAAMAMVNFLDYESTEGREHAQDIRDRMGKKKGGDNLVVTFGSLLRELRGMWTPELQTKYERIMAKQLAESGDDAEDDASIVPAAKVA